ncbi:sensor histidine kinase [Catenovulum sp. SM1970]|uniref:sensor histidine kinase n=1 Tax=Marinifaba aquimaris TaxID=2741323 RepID=UPI001571715E|nr:ATP-binding protein [Marinifaba aquimaris]NTS77649.1 sensor histidine kinase [Marinifaba aquimaris]
MKTTSLSRKLLSQVLSVYFVLTVMVTLIQIAAEYVNAKEHIAGELKTLQKTFSGSLTRAIWELNTQQAVTIAEGLLAIPMIEGLVVRDENGQIITEMGRQIESGDIDIQYGTEGATLEENQSGLFGYTFPLIFEFSGRATQVGDVTLISSRDVIISRIEVGLYFLVGNAFLKTTVLILLFLGSFKRLLSEPLTDVTEQIDAFDMERLQQSKIDYPFEEGNELKVLTDAYNKLIDELDVYNQKLETAQRDLIEANNKLDEHNLMLEQEVAKKTSTLSHAMLDLESQKQELERGRNELRDEIDIRRRAEDQLMSKHKELERSLRELKQAQSQLVESEKMASLGGLVAGIAHDVNTPVGVSVTASSFLNDQLESLKTKFEDKTLTPKHMEKFIADAGESLGLVSSNLKRASDLMNSFKQVAVDQTSDAIRTIELKSYIQDVIKSLQPRLKKTSHDINLTCPADINMRCPAGAISQIFTNLIMNSVIHGFEEIDKGQIDITVNQVDEEHISILYKDNGKGVSADVLSQLFDPFFTTKRENGGSGLGTHITYNLVRQTLGGEINAESELGKGLSFVIDIPINTQVNPI